MVLVKKGLASGSVTERELQHLHIKHIHSVLCKNRNTEQVAIRIATLTEHLD